MSALPVDADLPPEAVALHPERTDDPATVRWVVAGRVCPSLTGADVEALVAPGVLARVTVERGAVRTTLSDGRDWRTEAAGVRGAVASAVAAARAAEGGADAAGTDAALLAEARRVVADDVNPYAAGHGGSLQVLGAQDGTVEIRLGGACHGCPAAAFTVQGRLGRQLADAPGFRGVRITSR